MLCAALGLVEGARIVDSSCSSSSLELAYETFKSGLSAYGWTHIQTSYTKMCPHFSKRSAGSSLLEMQAFSNKRGLLSTGAPSVRVFI